MLDEYSARALARCGNARRIKRRQQTLARGGAAVDAQSERRTLVACSEDRLPLIGIFAPHAGNPPTGVRPARDGVGGYRRDERLALAQISPKKRIDESLRGRTRQDRRDVDRVVDHREGWRSHVIELIK